MAVILAKNHEGNPLATTPSKESEYGRSTTETNRWPRGIRTGDLGIRAEDFRKTAMPLGYVRLIWLMAGLQPDSYCMEHV